MSLISIGFIVMRGTQHLSNWGANKPSAHTTFIPSVRPPISPGVSDH